MERATRKITPTRPPLGKLAAALLFIVCAAMIILGAAFTSRITAQPGFIRIPLPEPLIFVPMEAGQARTINAAIPFAVSVGAAAEPFAFAGSAENRERAIDCLASAMLYEAGDDARGQRAVGQVVLNRVRHPAFPASVCGVIFQGSERLTGCQFTFTCDGAMQRIPSQAALARARVQALSMLGGKVDPEVGLATHYHTDWVHPVWSAQMEKLAKVDTHLFFRWRGKWGGAAAMAQGYSGVEPNIPALADIAPTHRTGLPGAGMISTDFAAVSEPLASAFAEPVPLAPVPVAVAAPAVKAANVFDLSLAPSGNAAAPALAALEMCGDKSFCKVVGNLPASSAPAFLYVRDRRTGVEKTYWDCGAFPRKDAAQCLSPGNRWLAFEGNLQSGGA